MKVAVLGATGLVGREMLRVLEERAFPVDEIVLLASERSAGRKLPFKGEEIVVQRVVESAFNGVDIALFSAGSKASKSWAKVAAAKGALVIDNSSAWRMDPKVPLVVPEINPEDTADNEGIIANPNCATIQALMVLAPLHRAARLEYFSVVTFQAVSGTGHAAVEELSSASSQALLGESPVSSVYPKPISFNVLPHIGPFDEEGVSEEEWKMIRESRKILHIPSLAVSVTTTRVPVFRGHSEAIVARFEQNLSPQEAKALLKEAPGVCVVETPEEAPYPTPLEASGTDPVYVGRIRVDKGMERALDLWVVADNLRKGAALNAVQIAELFV